MSGSVPTNNGPVPEFQRKARQKREGVALGGDGMQSRATLLPNIATTGVSASMDSATWARQTGSLPGINQSHTALGSPPRGPGMPDTGSPREAVKLRMDNFMKWTEKQSFLGEMDLDRREKELALMRTNQHEANKLLLESWLNEVLDNNPRLGKERTATKSGATSTTAGLSSYGLSRSELASLGLVGEQIDRLYRSLYVYTVGFHDSLRSMLKHCKDPSRLVESVWRGYVNIGDAAIGVGFKSEFLQLVESKNQSSSQLLLAEEAMAEARRDQAELEKTNTWLTGAHSEERAIRQALEKQVEGIRAELDYERQEHTKLLQRYMSEVENRTKAQDWRVAADEVDRLRGSLEVLAEELGTSRESVQKLSVDTHTAHRLAKEAEMLEAQGRSQREADRVRIADLNKRLASSWKEIEQLKSELKEEVLNHRHIMEDIRIKQQAIAEQESILNDHRKFQQTHKEEALKLKRELQSVEEMKVTIEHEKADMQGVIDNLRADVDNLEERLATKRMKKRDYKLSLEQLVSEHEDIKRAYIQHDQEREREKERMHEIENRLTEKTALLKEKEALNYILNHGISSTVPVIWKQQGALAYDRQQMADTRAEVKRLTEVVESRDAVIDAKRQEIIQLNRVLRNMEVDLENVRDMLRERTTEMDEIKRKLGDAEAAHHLDTMKFDKEVIKYEQSIKAARKASDKLKGDLAKSKNETGEAQRKMTQVEMEMGKLLEDHKGWRSEKYLMEDKLHHATEAKLTIEKDLIKVRAEALNNLNEYISTKKLLDIARETAESDSKALEESKRQLFNIKEETDTILSAMMQMINKFKALISDLEDDDLNGVRQVVPMKEDFQFLFERIFAQQTHAANVIRRKKEEIEASQQEVATLREANEKGLAYTEEKVMEVRLSMQAQLEEEAVKLKEMQAEKEVLQAKLEEINIVKEQYMAKAEEREKEIQALEGDLSSLNKSKLDVNARLALEEARRQEDIDNLEKQLAHVKDLLQVETTAHAGTTETLKQTKEVVATRNINITQMKLRFKRMEAQIKDLNGKLRNANSVRNYLQMEVGRLQDFKKKTNSNMRDMVELVDQQKAELQSAHMLISGGDHENQMQKFSEALQEKSNELHKVSWELTGELEAKDEKIRVMEEQLVNMTGQLEDAQDSLKSTTEQLNEHKKSALLHKEEMSRQVEATRDELLGEMRVRETKLNKQLQRAKLTAEKAAEQYARETAEREYKTSLQSMEIETIPFMRSGKVAPASRGVRHMAYTEAALKHALSEVVFATAGPALHLGMLTYRPVTLLVIIGEILLGKSQRDLQLMQEQRAGNMVQFQSVEEYTFDMFLQYFGIRSVVESHLHRFVNNMMSHRYKHKRINMFGRLLGLYDPIPEDGMRFYLNALSSLHQGNGPFRREHNEGTATVTARVAMGVLPDMFQGCTGKGAMLTKTIMSSVMDNLDGELDLDILLEMVMDAWEAEKTGLETKVILRFQELLEGAEGGEQIPYAEFQKALEDSLMCKDPKAVKNIYRDLVGWQDDGNTITDDTLLDVIQAQGQLELRGSVRMPQKVMAPTKYDSFLLLEDSWEAIKHELDMQIPRLTGFANAGDEVEGLKAAMEKLQGVLRMRVQLDLSSGWALYRRILSLYVIARTRLEIMDNEKMAKTASEDLKQQMMTRLPASEHRRKMFGQSPVKLRTIQGIKQQNQDRIDRKSELKASSLNMGTS